MLGIQKIKAVLFDAMRDHENIEVDIEVTSNGISIQPHGTGVKTEKGGPPIWIELYDGELRLVVWNDINQEEPTLIIPIPLAGAKEVLFKEDKNEIK